MTPSGGIGGLPAAGPLDGNCGCCAGGGGGASAVGVGGQELSATPQPPSLTGGQTTNLVQPGDLVATITNPNADTDLWVSATIDLGSLRLDPGVGYAGRLAWQAQAVNAGPFTLAAPIISGEGGQDGSPRPYVGEMHMELPEATFGFLLPAAATETISVSSSIRLQDDGSDGTYFLSMLSQPRISFIGVPV